MSGLSWSPAAFPQCPRTHIDQQGCRARPCTTSSLCASPGALVFRIHPGPSGFLSVCPWFFLHGSSTKEGPFLCDQNFSVTTQRILGLIFGSRSDIHLVIFMVGPRVRLVAPGPPATTTAACKPADLKRSMGTRTRTGFLKFLTDRFTELSVGFKRRGIFFIFFFFFF